MSHPYKPCPVCNKPMMMSGAYDKERKALVWYWRCTGPNCEKTIPIPRPPTRPGGAV